MKFAIEEHVKHRLTGLVVILSIAIIFVPALMRKSNQRFEENVSLSVKLPAKPTSPSVSIRDEKALFQTIKLAHVDKPVLVEAPPVTKEIKAASISSRSTIPAVIKAPVIAKSTVPAIMVKKLPPVVVASIPLRKAKVLPSKKETFSIQLASFSQQSNAQALVTRLRNQGYVATYTKFLGKQGELYKVLVGQLEQKNEAIHLQKKLEMSMQLQGFIVKGAS